MDIKAVKKLIKTVGVKKWIESGHDIVRMGDNLLDKKEGFSRLDYYNKTSWLELTFYETEEELLNNQKSFTPCGEITFNNGGRIFYEVRVIQER